MKFKDCKRFFKIQQIIKDFKLPNISKESNILINTISNNKN